MNLYLIYQDVNNGYDTYDSAVVCASNEKEAKTIHPGGFEDWDGSDTEYSTWCGIEDVKVELIGTAIEGSVVGVICASFNAG